MDENQQAISDNINQQLIQEALSSEFNQNQQPLQQQGQPNTFATFSPNVAHGLVENATNFETLAPSQNFLSDPTLHMQTCGIPSSSNSTIMPPQYPHVDNLATNPLESENEYIYQQYIQMMNNSNHPTFDLNFQNFHPQQLQPPALPARQEQDVFDELLSMASDRNQQHRPWHYNQFASSSASSSTPLIGNLEASILITQQEKEQQQQQQQQQQQKTSFYDSFASSSDNINITPLLHENSTNNSTKISQDFAHPSANNYREYKIEIVQQPSRARMCGFGDKDRRPISPPPILKLTILSKNGQIINPETFDISFLVSMCDACQQSQSVESNKNNSSSSITTENTTIVSKTLEKFSTQIVSFPNNFTDEPGKDQYTAIKMRNLVGASVASATKLYDLDGNLGIFFVFQDISLRMEGVFRLQFSLIDIGSPLSHNVNTTTVSQVLSVVETDPFVVYTAKKYPGVVHSTPLSKCFARQGIKIPIRKEKVNHKTSKRNARGSSLTTVDLSEDDTDEDEL